MTTHGLPSKVYHNRFSNDLLPLTSPRNPYFDSRGPIRLFSYLPHGIMPYLPFHREMNPFHMAPNIVVQNIPLPNSVPAAVSPQPPAAVRPDLTVMANSLPDPHRPAKVTQPSHGPPRKHFSSKRRYAVVRQRHSSPDTINRNNRELLHPELNHPPPQYNMIPNANHSANHHKKRQHNTLDSVNQYFHHPDHHCQLNNATYPESLKSSNDYEEVNAAHINVDVEDNEGPQPSSESSYQNAGEPQHENVWVLDEDMVHAQHVLQPIAADGSAAEYEERLFPKVLCFFIAICLSFVLLWIVNKILKRANINVFRDAYLAGSDEDDSHFKIQNILTMSSEF